MLRSSCLRARCTSCSRSSLAGKRFAQRRCRPTEFGPRPMQEPRRLDRSLHDDFQNKCAGYYHPSFVAVPSPGGYAQPLRHLLATAFPNKSERKSTRRSARARLARVTSAAVFCRSMRTLPKRRHMLGTQVTVSKLNVKSASWASPQWCCKLRIVGSPISLRRDPFPRKA